MAQSAFFSGMNEVGVNVSEVRILPTSDSSAAVSFTAELFLIPAGMTEGVSLQSRFTMHWVKRDGVWLILQEHGSVEPAGMM